MGRKSGFKHSEETKRKIGEKSKLKIMSDEARRKISDDLDILTNKIRSYC